MNVKATLNAKTVAELRKLAAQFNIAGRSAMKKDELIDAIEAEYTKRDTEAGALLDAVLGETPETPRVKALITRDVPGAAFFNISNGVGGVIVRYGRVFELVTGSGETITIRARSMVKAVKRLAVKLGIHLDAIDVVKAF
jgi:preprotein translocase subunit SecA